jgi:hypothetical protein
MLLSMTHAENTVSELYCHTQKFYDCYAWSSKKKAHKKNIM